MIGGTWLVDPQVAIARYLVVNVRGSMAIVTFLGRLTSTPGSLAEREDLHGSTLNSSHYRSTPARLRVAVSRMALSTPDGTYVAGLWYSLG